MPDEMDVEELQARVHAMSEALSEQLEAQPTREEQLWYCIERVIGLRIEFDELRGAFVDLVNLYVEQGKNGSTSLTPRIEGILKSHEEHEKKGTNHD